MFPLQGPTTTREISFVQAYGRDLHEAREACRAYTTYGETAMLDRAWDIYYGVRWIRASERAPTDGNVRRSSRRSRNSFHS